MRRQGRRKDIRGCRALNASLCQVSTGAEDVLSPPGVESSRWVVTALPYNTVCTFSLTVLVSGLNLDVARLPPPAACGLPPAAGRRSAGFIPAALLCSHHLDWQPQDPASGRQSTTAQSVSVVGPSTSAVSVATPHDVRRVRQQDRLVLDATSNPSTAGWQWILVKRRNRSMY